MRDDEHRLGRTGVAGGTHRITAVVDPERAGELELDEGEATQGTHPLPGGQTRFRDRVAQEIYSPTWALDARPWSLPDFFFLVGIE